MPLVDKVGNDVVVGKFVVYATKTEAPGLSFGWVNTVKSKVDTSRIYNGEHPTEHKVKVTHAEPDGSVINKRHFNYDPEKGTGHWEDTGIPNTSWLTAYGSHDDRMLVMEPIK